jgi:hypothetical protein
MWNELFPEDNLNSAKDFRNRWDTLTFNDWARSDFDVRGSVMCGLSGGEVEEGGGVVEFGGVWVRLWRASMGGWAEVSPSTG